MMTKALLETIQNIKGEGLYPTRALLSTGTFTFNQLSRIRSQKFAMIARFLIIFVDAQNCIYITGEAVTIVIDVALAAVTFSIYTTGIKLP